MKSGPILLAALVLVGLVFAVETCVDCAEFVNAPNGRLFTVINNEDRIANIFAYYEDSTASPSRVPINNTVLIIELTNSSDMDPEIYKVYTNDEGQATFDFTTWSQACVDMKILYCPFCANESANCGFAECLSFSGLHSEAGYYHNVPPGEEILNASSIPDGPGSIPKPSVLNNGKYLPDVTVSNYCAPPSNSIATPPMCLPLIIVFALLGGALYLSGQNPFGVFNLGSPRMGKHIKYQAKGRGFSFSGMALVQAASSVASTVKQVKEAKAKSAEAAAKGEKNADGTPKQPLTTTQAYFQVGRQTAAQSVFLVSGLSRLSSARQTRAAASDAAAKKGGTTEGQQLRAAKNEEIAGRGGSRGVSVGGGSQYQSSGSGENRNSGATLMQKWGGSYGGNLLAGLTTAAVGLLVSMPIFQIAGTCGFNPMRMIENAGVSNVAGAQANVKAQTDAKGNLPVETPSGKQTAIERVEPTQVPVLDKDGNPIPGKDGKPITVPDPSSTTVTFAAPAPAKEEKAGAAAPTTAGEVKAGEAAPKAGEAAPKAEGEKQKVPETPPGPAKVDVKMDNATGQVTGMGYDAKDGSRVSAEPAPDGSTKLSVTPPADPKAPAGTPPPEPQNYKIAADGTITGANGAQVTDPKQIEAIKAMAAPATNGENPSGLKLGETPKMPVGWEGGIPLISPLTGAGKADTFLDVCKEKAIQYQEATVQLNTVLGEKAAELHGQIGAAALSSPEGRKLIEAAATNEAANALALALGKPVDAPTDKAAALGTAAKLGETLDNQATLGTQHGDLFRGGFGARAAESTSAALNPNPSDDSRTAIQTAGSAIDGVIRTTSLKSLESMSPTQLEAAVVHQLTTPEKPGLPPPMTETQAKAVVASIDLGHAASEVSSAAKDLRAGMVDHMGADAAKQMESIPPRQFAQLCESAVLVYRATKDESEVHATELILRSDPEKLKSLPPDVRAQVAEYAAVEAARSTSERVGYGGSHRPDNDMVAAGTPVSFNSADRTASERAQDASTHAVEIAGYRELRSQADSLDDENRKMLPKGFEAAMKAHAEAFDTIAQANLAQLRLERTNLLDPIGTSPEGTLRVQEHEEGVRVQMKQELGYRERELVVSDASYSAGTMSDFSPNTGLISVGKTTTQDRTQIDYDATAATLASQAQRYSVAGDEDTAKMYRESLFSLTRAREADAQFHAAETSNDAKGMEKYDRIRTQQLDQVERRLAPPEQVETWTQLNVGDAADARAKGEAELAKAREKAEKIAARDAVDAAVSRQRLDDRPFH